MKNFMLRMLAFMFCGLILLPLAACNTKEAAENQDSAPASATQKPTVVGVWKANIDALDIIDIKENKELAALLVLMGDTPLSVDITMDIKEDGTAELTLDTKAAVVFLKELAEKIDEQDVDLSALLNSLKDKLGLSEDMEFPETQIPEGELSELPIPNIDIPTIEELADSVIEKIKSIDIEKIEPEKSTFKYIYEDGKLYFAAEGKEISKDTAIVIELTADALVITGIEMKKDVSEIIPGFEMPEIRIEFKKAVE